MNETATKGETLKDWNKNSAESHVSASVSLHAYVSHADLSAYVVYKYAKNRLGKCRAKYGLTMGIKVKLGEYALKLLSHAGLSRVCVLHCTASYLNHSFTDMLYFGAIITEFQGS
jgi:hypothetical protein